MDSMGLTRYMSVLMDDAMKQARFFDHEFVMPEHMLLALLRQYAFCQALQEEGVDSLKMHEDLVGWLAKQERVPETIKYLPEPSSLFKTMFGTACALAAAADRQLVNVPHFVQAMFGLQNSEAAFLLCKNVGDRQGEFLASVDSYYPIGEDTGEAGMGMGADFDDDDYANEYDDDEEEGRRQVVQDWHQLVTCISDKVEEHNPLIGREQELDRTIQVLCRAEKNNPLHIGEAGVGKTALVYGLAKLINENQVPERLKGVVDRYHSLIKKSFEEFGISFDVYSRTSSPTHHQLASDFFKTLYDKGEFIEKTSEQYYDEEAKTFLADRYITGECPHCHSEGAYGDQCEKCGTSLSPTDLINPKSAISGSKPVMKETKHWYLPLDKHEAWLRKWILEDHKEWRPNVYGQCKSWLDMGLQPRAVSRDLDWGIPVPVEGAEGKVLYVWFDAPIGYISNTKELLPDSWETWWKDPETRLIHFIGKDNIVFHCIVFPAMLKAEGSYILPDNVPSNEFLNLEGDKISTSRNWAVWLHEYLADFPGKQDVLRYVLTANAPETKDNDFTWKDFQARNNNELVAVYGNFVNRAMVLTQKYFDGKVPAQGELTDYDKETLKEFADVKAEVEKLLDIFKFRDAQKEAMNLARIGNKYLADTEPWKLAKTDMERVGTILNISLQLVANLAIAFDPFLPFSSEKLRKMLNMDTFEWAELGKDNLLPVGHQLNKPELLFEKIEDATIEAQVQKLLDTKKANEEANYKANPIRPNIEFDDFTKLDIRVGTILECQKVPKADKLLQFKIDDGLETRTIVSGIAKHYQPEELAGKQVCFIANLAPRKLKGIVSEGMILSAENNDGSLAVIMPGREVKPGSEVK